MPPRKKTPVKKKAVRRKRVPPIRKKFQLKQWHGIMIAILATAAVITLGFKAISGSREIVHKWDSRWVHSQDYDKATEALVDTDIKLGEKIQLVAQRLDQKITQDKIDWRWKQMQELMSKFGSFEKMPQWARDKYLGLQKEINDIKTGKKLAF